GSNKDRPGSRRDSAYHFTLLSKNEAGYRNLVKLVTAAHHEGFHYAPRIDKELLAAHSEGLIGLSGCLAGEINSAIQANNIEKAKQSAADYRDILGAENFFIELHDHGIEEQRKCNSALPQIARDLGIGLVAANDVHFLRRSDHQAHDVMLCIGTGKMVQDETRMRYVPELYFKSPDEMREVFRDLPQAIENTLKIGERCHLDLEFGRSKYPQYPVPDGKKREGYLRELCYNGLRQRYGERRVAQIITVGKLNAKSVDRDVGRVMGWSYRDADRIAKMIPNELNITLDSAVEKNPELKRAVATEPATRQLFDYAKVLEGLSRNAGVHAAGVVIADRDLSDYI